MKLRLLIPLAMFSANLAAQPLKLVTIPDGDSKEGAELQVELLAQRPSNSTITAVLKTRDGSGQRTEIPVKLETRIIDDAHWEATYETTPPDAKLREKLTVAHLNQQPNTYRLTRAGATNDVVLNGEKVFTAFAGTDFYAGDLGLEFLHWPKQIVLKHEMKRGRPCRVLESKNPASTGVVYGRVVSWVDTETGGLLRAEAYDAKDQLLKEFSVRSFKKIEGHWELKEMEILNVQTDTRTRLEFNLIVQ